MVVWVERRMCTVPGKTESVMREVTCTAINGKADDEERPIAQHCRIAQYDGLVRVGRDDHSQHPQQSAPLITSVLGSYNRNRERVAATFTLRFTSPTIKFPQELMKHEPEEAQHASRSDGDDDPINTWYPAAGHKALRRVDIVTCHQQRPST
ncbi:hypothetical protein BC826DRAFT_1137345 [Russula brevipes]|nr:hypothetical protein BC826DRAFT_1137345 [Russula brevipes]